jgi:hypothetical protein
MFKRVGMDGFRSRTFQPGRHGLVPEPRRQPEAARHDDRMSGRVMALYGMIFRAGPAVGAVLMGSLREYLGLRLALALGAIDRRLDQRLGAGARDRHHPAGDKHAGQGEVKRFVAVEARIASDITRCALSRRELALLPSATGEVAPITAVHETAAYREVRH